MVVFVEKYKNLVRFRFGNVKPGITLIPQRLPPPNSVEAQLFEASLQLNIEPLKYDCLAGGLFNTSAERPEIPCS
jgi:hypothetical protein